MKNGFTAFTRTLPPQPFKCPDEITPLLFKELHNNRLSKSYFEGHLTLELFPRAKYMS